MEKWFDPRYSRENIHKSEDCRFKDKPKKKTKKKSKGGKKK